MVWHCKNIGVTPIKECGSYTDLPAEPLDLDTRDDEQVYDPVGAIIGSGYLNGGLSASRGACTFTLPGLPSEDFCQVEIAHRGRSPSPVTTSRAGNVHLSIS